MLIVLCIWLSLSLINTYCILFLLSASNLVTRLVSVLESIEKLPIYAYDNNSSAHYGLQILHRRLRFRLERSSKESALIDRTGEVSVCTDRTGEVSVCTDRTGEVSVCTDRTL